MPQLIMGLAALLCLGVVCALVAQRAGVNAAALPLPVLCGAAVLLYVFGCAGALPAGFGAVYALALACVLFCLHSGVKPAQAVRGALQSPGFVLFLAGSIFIWLLFAVRQPMFTQWDEFTAWGLAPKMVVQRGAFYVAEPINLTASFTYPGTSLVAYLFHFGGHFAEWSCLAALDTLFLAAAAAVAALPRAKWPHAILLFGGAVLLPFFFSTVPTGTYATQYANAMADLPLAFLFGGALCLYYNNQGQGQGNRRFWLAAPVLALLALTKDIGFAYGCIAAFVMGLDLWLGGGAKPTRRSFVQALAKAGALAVVVLAAFASWNLYTAAVAPAAQTGASVGSAGLSYGQVLTGGVAQLLGFGREAKFAQIMAAMGDAFFTRRVCLLGAGVLAVALIAAVAAAAGLVAPKGQRRRALVAFVGLGVCFAALYLFHLILYHYNFSDLEGLALKDYDRYLYPFYQGWLLAVLCLLANAAHSRRGHAALGAVCAALVAVFCWRGVPTAGFWSAADSVYTQRADVRRRAAAANTQLDWGDRLLVLSQGDDATRWYYYKYELTAKVVNGFGGFYGRLGETDDRWDSDFMNLVESENWTLYDYKAVCVPETLVAYLAETDCDYLLIDRADDYLARAFSPLFEGGLTADMPATLYHFEGEDAALPFTIAAVAESEVG